MGTQEPVLNEEIVERLARLAELPLDDGRRAAVTEALAPLLAEAAVVNRYMGSRPQVQPGVRFHHPGVEGGE